MKKILSAVLLGSLAMSPVAAQTGAQDWPNQPIRLVVPAGAGGITDSVARIVSEKVGQILKQTVVVENRPGASGVIGSSQVSRARPDGYTLLMVFPSHVVNPGLRKEMPYDTAKDFAPISKVGSVSAILLVRADSEIDNAKAFIEAAKARPGDLNYGSVGVGSLGYLSMLLFASRAGIDMTHVPYKGDPEVLAALVRGDVQAAFVSPISSLGMLEAGKVRALAIADTERSPILPDLPTVAEAALPGFSVTGWNGIFAPVGTPRPIIDKVNAAINLALKDPELTKRLVSQGVTPIGCTPEELQQAVESDIDTITRALRAAGVEPA